jgi:hypothetical protein
LTRGYTFSPVIRDDTFEEIKSAGGLGIIRNKTLAIDLMRFYSDVRGELASNCLRLYGAFGAPDRHAER